VGGGDEHGKRGGKEGKGADGKIEGAVMGIDQASASGLTWFGLCLGCGELIGFSRSCLFFDAGFQEPNRKYGLDI